MQSTPTATGRVSAAVICAALLSASARADTLLVGEGAPYEDIQTAVDAAAPGDTVLVLPGVYPSFAVDKTLTIIGAGPALTNVFNPGFFGGHTALVRDIDASETLVLSGLNLLPAFPATLDFGVVDIADCQGLVVLHNLAIDGNTANCAIRATRASALVASAVSASGNGNAIYPYPLYLESTTAWLSSTHVTEQNQPSVFQETVLAGGGALRSSLFLYNSTISGANIDPPFFSPGGDGLSLRDSSLQLVRSGLFGGQGFGMAMGGHGARLEGTSHLMSYPDSSVFGGLDGEGQVMQEPLLLEAGALADFAQSLAPSLHVQTPTVFSGDNLSLELFGAPASTGTLLVSLGMGTPLEVPTVLGTLFLNPATVISLGSHALDASGTAAFALAVPDLSELQGKLVVFQFLAPEGMRLSLSNPGVVSLL